MRKEELVNLKIGDIVTISARGKNYGKRGIVSGIGPIHRHGSTGIFLKPLDSEFEFSKGYYLSEEEKRTKTYMYRHPSIQLENKEEKEYAKEVSHKDFYIQPMFGVDGISWPTDDFTHKELNIIDKFLKQLNKKISGLCVDGIEILDRKD